MFTLTPNEIADQLENAGIGVCPNFICGQTLADTQADFAQLLKIDAFHRAGVGHTADLSIQDTIRRDEIHWLERTDTTNRSQIALWNQFDELKTVFNRKLFLGLNDFEAHYANYPPGGFYSRHLDSFAKNNSRVVSLVLYLNSHWQESDGGKLRIYRGDQPHDIAPVAGTLVCFMSQDIEHEVLASHACRRSIAGWFRQND